MIVRIVCGEQFVLAVNSQHVGLFGFKLSKRFRFSYKNFEMSELFTIIKFSFHSFQTKNKKKKKGKNLNQYSKASQTWSQHSIFFLFLIKPFIRKMMSFHFFLHNIKKKKEKRFYQSSNQETKYFNIYLLIPLFFTFQNFFNSPLIYNYVILSFAHRIINYTHKFLFPSKNGLAFPPHSQYNDPIISKTITPIYFTFQHIRPNPSHTLSLVSIDSNSKKSISPRN